MIQFYFADLRRRLVILFFVATIPTLVLALYINAEQQRSAINAVQNNTLLLAQFAALNQDSLVDNGQQLLVTLSQLPRVRDRTQGNCSTLLSNILAQYKQYTNFYVADLKGDVWCSGLALTQATNVSDRGYFKQALENNAFTVGEYAIGRLTGKAVLPMAYPVMNDVGGVQSVVMLGLDLGWLNKNISQAQLPQGTILSIVDRRGTYLAHFPASIDQTGKTLKDTPLFQAMVSSNGQGGLETTDVEGILRIYAFSTLSRVAQPGDIYVVVAIPVEIAYASATRTRTNYLIGVAVATLLAFISTWIGSTRMILRPVNRIINTAQALAAGDMNARANLHNESGVLGQLATAFDSMAQVLDERNAQLEEAEARYRALVEQVPAVLYRITITPERRMIYIGPQVESMLGYPRSEWFDNPTLIEFHLHPEDRGNALAGMVHSLTTGEPFQAKYRVFARDGRIVWLHNEAAVVRDEHGDITALQGIMVDVTSREEAKAAQQASEARYRLLAENINDLVCLASLDSKLIYVSPSSERLLGYSPEELIGVEGGSLIHPDDLALVRSQGREQSIRGLSTTLAYRMRKKSGEYIWVETHLQPIVNSNGKTIQLITSTRDIDERKRAEDALRESEQRYRTLVDTAQEGIWVLDAEAKTTYVNQHMADMLGYSVAEMMDRRLYDFMDEVARVEAVQHFERRKQGIAEQYDFCFTRKDGSILWVMLSTNPIYNSAQQFSGALKMCNDITDRVQAEAEIRSLNLELEQRVTARTTQLEVANKELEAFSYSVSHDLRAPLRAVNGFARILLQDFAPQLSSEAVEYLELISANGIKMGHLIDDLLQFSRLGRKAIQKQTLDMREFVQKAVDDLGQVNAEIVIGDLPPCEADPALLKQVFANLLGNAVKFTSKCDNPRIEIGSQTVQGTLAYYIKDNGAGFDMQYVNKLFGVFQRLHTAEEFEGTGVGLAIVQRVIQRHDGRVWAESEVNKGATFYFTLGEESNDK
ncbi:MAG: PAS domain S-box protein [Chloroflexota bacterium]